MYYPYLRGKQFELITIRDLANISLLKNTHPIIEPVRKDFRQLNRTIEALHKKRVGSTLIINPMHGGDKKANTEQILEEVINNSTLSAYLNMGIILEANSNIEQELEIVDQYNNYKFTIIHYGYPDGKNIAELIRKKKNISRNVFIERKIGKLYQMHFQNHDTEKILIRDGFNIQRKNALYPLKEHFSDLHITYKMENMDGFGDFLIVGDEYSETGGPAYAVVIHLTYLNHDDNDMFIYHFKSDQTDSPVDPGGKFLEALKKMIKEVKKSRSSIYKSNACIQFIQLNEKEHFPGLGMVKKLSMQHHIELIENYLSNK